MSEVFPDADARRKERKERDREEFSQEQLDLQALMSEGYGRRVVHRLLDHAGVFRISHTPGDPYETAFKEGSRNQGNWLLTQLMSTTPEQYAQMLKENSDGR